jgi:hypothetical protein
MKRICLSLSLLCLAVTATCIPPFIQNQRILPTPEQIEIYQRKVRERPDEYSFNPMHPNDYWIYEIEPPFPGGPVEYGYFCIVADTLIGGIPHFKAGRIGSDRNHWLKNDNNISTEYLKTENFSSTSGISDTLYWSLGAGFPYEQTLAYIGTSFYLSIFGELVEAKDCWYLSAASCNLIWARKFGIIYSECEFTSMRLIGAYIDGQGYGTVAIDESVNQPNDILTTKCYPNPFKHCLTITYDASHIKDGNCYIEVYNIKGQRILKENLNDSGMFTWNSRDKKSFPIASGIYFYRINGNNLSSKITKVTHSK